MHTVVSSLSHEACDNHMNTTQSISYLLWNSFLWLFGN